MTKKDVTIYYGIIMAVYSIGYVTMSAFSSVYLLDVGLSSGNVGVLLAIASLIAVFIQPFVGALIDKNPKVSSKGMLLGIAIVVVMIGGMIILLPGKSKGVEALLYGSSIMLLMLAQPFLNSLGVDAINYGYPLNLGLGRSMGSLGYALGSYAFGWISVQVGPRCIPVAFSVAFLVLIVFLYLYPVDTRALSDDKNIEAGNVVEQKENPLAFLGRYKRFACMLIGLIFVYFSHSLINTFALQVVTSKGGSSGDMGTASALAAICELITTILFVWYMKKIELSLILKISCVFFTLKILFSFIVNSVAGFYLIQGFQMFGWGFMSVGLVYYVNNLMSMQDKAKGQAYAGMAYTIACVLATFLGGNIIDYFGVDWMLISGTIVAFVGTIVVWFTADKARET